MSFLYTLNLNILFDFSIPAMSGFLIWLSIYFFRQTWIDNFYILLVFILLPSSIFVITKVISNNIALALGMVGALSIVRFRNPVKSPFELVMYFVLITIGITFSVSRIYGFSFVFFVLFVNLAFSIFRKQISKIFKIKNSYNMKLYSLQIVANKKINYENSKEYLSEENIFYNNNEYIYRFTSDQKKNLYKIKNDIENSYSKDKIQSIQLDVNEE